MPTIEQHLTAIYERLADFERRLAALAANPLEQDIDLELPHASAGSAAPEGAAAGGEATVETDVTDDALTVRLPAPTSEQKETRRRFAAEVLKLNETFPDLDVDGGPDAVACYAQGGPMWLYLGGKEGRDHILSLPVQWRQAMVDDVAQFSTKEAHEFGRDVLKDMEPSAGMGVSYDYLLSTVE